MEITLNDLLNFNENEIDNVRIRFNQSNGIENPMELYKSNPDEVNTKWFLWRTKDKFFKVGQIAICLLKLQKDTWLLTTIKRITKDLDVTKGINYEAEELPQHAGFYGRVIIKYHKYEQSSLRKYDSICNNLVVTQILPSRFDGDEFPGYDNVRLSYNDLSAIIKLGKKDWITALSNQKAVYLITDKSTGKLYVGSATSDKGMLLNRWTTYAENGHGGNVELKELVNTKGFDYIKNNFQYSILENYNAKVDDSIILKREDWWKETLQSRKFGYNRN